MLDTVPSSANRTPLKLSDLIVADFTVERGPVDLMWTNDPAQACRELPSMGLGGDRLYRGVMLKPEYAKFEGSLMTLDPAGRGKDELGIAITKVLGGRIFVPFIGGLRGGYADDNLIRVCELAKEQQVKKIVAEENFGNGMFTGLLIPHLKRIYPECSIEEVHSSGQKEKRIIETLEPVMNQHRLVFLTKALQNDLLHVDGASIEEELTYHLQHQLTRITRDRGSLKHDDRLDALALGVSHWVNFMKVSLETAKKKAVDRETEDEFLAWYRDSGRDPSEPHGVGHYNTIRRFLPGIKRHR
jgi:hypothetical protein